MLSNTRFDQISARKGRRWQELSELAHRLFKVYFFVCVRITTL